MKKFILFLITVNFLNAYYSQCGQDRFLYENFFRNTKEGVYIDIGAHDGIEYSNTKFFEEIGWRGVCIEPIPEVFERLKKNRTALCIQGCISDHTGKSSFLRVKGYSEMLSGLVDQYDPRHLNRIFREIASVPNSSSELIEVDCFLLNQILEDNRLYRVDYLSLDTEGSELMILKSIDYSKFDIRIIDVENNYGDPEIKSFLISKGFRFLGNIDWDEIYIQK